MRMILQQVKKKIIQDGAWDRECCKSVTYEVHFGQGVVLEGCLCRQQTVCSGFGTDVHYKALLCLYADGSVCCAMDHLDSSGNRIKCLNRVSCMTDKGVGRIQLDQERLPEEMPVDRQSLVSHVGYFSPPARVLSLLMMLCCL